MLTTADATLYSKGISAGEESWTRSEIPDIHWEYVNGASKSSPGHLESDSAVVYIPTNARSVSINPGDVMVKGIVTDVIGVGFTITQLIAKYTDVMQVAEVHKFQFGSPEMHHLKVVGK